MASLNPKENISKDLVKPKDKEPKDIQPKDKQPKDKEPKEEVDPLEYGQMAAVEHIVNHGFIRESREFWKKEMAKEMQGQRDVNTKTIDKK